MIKADGSVLVHSDGGSYKPLNWMSPPCTLREGTTADGRVEWTVTSKTDDTLRILIEEVLHDTAHDLGADPGLQKDGVEKHLQELLSDHPATLADGLTLVRREFPTAIGPVDLMCRDADGRSVAVEIKRRGEIDGVEQLTRYLELLNRDPNSARCAASSPRRRSSPRPGSSPSIAGSPVPWSTTTHCAASTTRPSGFSDHADLPHRSRVGLAHSPEDRRVHDLDPGPHPGRGGVHPHLPGRPGQERHDAFYSKVRQPLVRLDIDTDRLRSEWREDPVGDDSYPHIYGPLNVDAVIAASPWHRSGRKKAFLEIFLNEAMIRICLAILAMLLALLGAYVARSFDADWGAFVGALIGLGLGITLYAVTMRRR